MSTQHIDRLSRSKAGLSASPTLPAFLVPVNLPDAELFHAALSGLRQPVSDASFAASLCWADALSLGWTLLEGHLCLFSAADGDLSMMLPPLALSPSHERRLPAALEACFTVMDDTNRDGPGAHLSRIEYVSDEQLDRIRDANTIPLSAAPMHGDYVYPRHALVDLAGGPLKGKRKLRSKFLRENAAVTVDPIRPDDVPDCITLLSRWREDGDLRHEGEANDHLLGVDVLRERDERCTLRYLSLIEHGEADRHGLESLLVRVGDRLAGFTIGEWLTPTMGVVAVEKTDPDVIGTPQFIYSEFCRARFESASEINAGDDWGIATLRATKLSYRPSRMLAKSVLTRQAAPAAQDPGSVQLLLRRPAVTAAQESPMASVRIERPSPADAPGILAVEAETFADPEDRFNARQIHRLIANPRARVAVARSGDRIVGWCVSLIRQHTRWRSGRVYSVAVRHECSGRGIGRSLLNWSLDQLAAEGIGRVYLEVREHNAPAIALYHDAGFVTVARLAAYYGPGIDGLRMRRLAASTQPQGVT